MSKDSLMQQMIAAGVDIMNPQAVYQFFHDQQQQGIDLVQLQGLISVLVAELIGNKADRDEVIQMLQGKLNRDEFRQNFKGVFISHDELRKTVTDAVAGDYAHVDAGTGATVAVYVYDADDLLWHKQINGSDLAEITELIQLWIASAVEDKAKQADLLALEQKKADKAIVTEQLGEKLNRSEFQQHFKGVFTSYNALKEQVTDAVAGDYANVDAGPGVAAEMYIYDADDFNWRKQAGAGIVVSSSDSVPEGNANLYFTEDRVLQVITPILGQVETYINQILGERP